MKQIFKMCFIGQVRQRTETILANLVDQLWDLRFPPSIAIDTVTFWTLAKVGDIILH